jgi:hypothetical protein
MSQLGGSEAYYAYILMDAPGDSHEGAIVMPAKMAAPLRPLYLDYRSRRVAENGRQFVVVAVGGHYPGNPPAGAYLMAFALPER